MQHKVTTISGELFAPTPIPAGPIVPPTITDTRELLDQYLTSLTTTPRTLMLPEEWAEVQQIVFDRMASNKRVLELLEQFRERAHEQILSEWEAAKEAVREQEKKIAAHKEEIAVLTRELNIRNDRKAQAFAARDAAQEKLRTLSRFSSANTAAKINAEVANREAEATKASEEAGAVQAQINHLTLVMLKPLMEKLNELVAGEADVRHQATGQGYTNSLGIVVPSMKPL